MKGALGLLLSELRVPHVTSSLARAPSSLLFCGVRNTHIYHAFCKFSEKFGQCPSPSLTIPHSAHALLAQRTRIPTSACSIGFCVFSVCINSSSSSSSSKGLKSFYEIAREWATLLLNHLGEGDLDLRKVGRTGDS